METRYTQEKITAFHRWTPKLLSFSTSRDPCFHFQAGQFARLGISHGDKILWRAYSMASAVENEQLEFYSIVVPEGLFTPKLVNLAIGDTIFVEKRAYGFLTVERFPQGGQLWLMASSTGICPFLAMLFDPLTWSRFEKIVLVLSVREAQDLIYQDKLNLLYEHPVFGRAVRDKFHYVTIVTRQPEPKCYQQRMTTLVEQRILEQDLNLPITVAQTRVMVCGNPTLVKDMRSILQARGLTLSRFSQPGNLAVEHFW